MSSEMAPAPARRRPYRRLSPDARREELITVALELFSATSPEQLSLEDVAAAAGVSRALVYRYFSSLNELYVEALRTATGGLIDRLVPPAEGPLLVQLDEAVQHFFEFAKAYAAGYVALLRSGSTISTTEGSGLVDDVRQHAVGELLSRLGIDEPTSYLLLTLRCWVASVEGTVLAWLQEGDIPSDDLRTWLVDQLCGMLVVSAGHDPRLAEQLREVVERQRAQGFGGPETGLPEVTARVMGGLMAVLPPD